jgi:hypothetical protein
VEISLQLTSLARFWAILITSREIRIYGAVQNLGFWGSSNRACNLGTTPLVIIVRILSYFKFELLAVHFMYVPMPI